MPSDLDAVYYSAIKQRVFEVRDDLVAKGYRENNIRVSLVQRWVNISVTDPQLPSKHINLCFPPDCNISDFDLMFFH